MTPGGLADRAQTIQTRRTSPAGARILVADAVAES
jgi:hypothetical protein